MLFVPLRFCAFMIDIYLSVALFYSRMSGSATLLSFVACGLGFWNWLNWQPQPVLIVEEPTGPSPAAEFACSCSCPSPSVQVVSQTAGGFDWKSFAILALSVLWLLSACVFCRSRRRDSTVVYQSVPGHHGYAALDDYSDALATRRALHVRGLRGGRGTMA